LASPTNLTTITLSTVSSINLRTSESVWEDKKKQEATSISLYSVSRSLEQIKRNDQDVALKTDDNVAKEVFANYHANANSIIPIESFSTVSKTSSGNSGHASDLSRDQEKVPTISPDNSRHASESRSMIEKVQENISTTSSGDSSHAAQSSERITQEIQEKVSTVSIISSGDVGYAPEPPKRMMEEAPEKVSTISTISFSHPSHGGESSENTIQEANEEIRSDRVTIGKVSQLHNLGPLQLQFVYEGNHQQRRPGENASKHLSCTMEWLSLRDIEILKLERKVSIVDAMSLTEIETSQDMDMSNSIYLSLEGAVLKVTVRAML
jgi:hypothetical protein